MATELRAFRAEFIHAFRGAWPPHDALHAWLRQEFGVAMRNGVYSRLRAGEPSDARHLERIIAYCRAPSSAPTPIERQVLDRHLRTLGKNPETLSVAQVLESVSVPVTFADHDPLNEGMALFRRFFDSIRNPAKGVRPCRDEAEACEAVRWLFIEGGRHARGRLDPEQAIEAAESHIGIRLEAYQRRTVDCWRREPWILVVCGTERRTTGMCLAIPLGDLTYEAVRRGAVNALHCSGRDLVSPSPNLFVEAAAMRPRDGEKKWRLPNLQLALAVITQHARLTSAPGVVTKQPMRLLAFAGTRAHGRWLKRFRYQPVGTRLNGTPFALMERRVRYGEHGGRDAPHIGVWQELQLSLGTDLKAGNDDDPRSSSPRT